MRRTISFNRLLQDGLSYVLLLMLAYLFIVPSINMIRDSFQLSPQGGPLLSNFLFLLREVPFSTYLSNSLIIVILTILAGLFVNSLLAYVLARMRWRWAGLVLGIVVAVMIIPFETLAVPLLLLTNQLGWLDSLHVQIIPFIADPFSIFLFYQFFKNFPRDLEDAAMVDGLGRLRIYWQILLPNATPVFASAAILRFLFLWDSYLWPVMVTRGPEARPLTVGIGGVWGPPRSAYALLMTLPTLILFLLLQRWFVKGVTSSGIRG